MALFLSGEVLDAKPGLTNDGTQGAAVQLFVVRDDHLGKRVIAAQDNVAAALANNTEAKPAQDGNAFLTGELGQFAHTATRIASKVSTGTGR